MVFSQKIAKVVGRLFKNDIVYNAIAVKAWEK
jgi:hypothetical protein